MIKTYADIIVDITSEKLDRSFQYLVPQHLEGRLQPGMQVQVPFGNGGRMIKGYVIRVTDQPSFDVSRMKEIRGVETGSNSIESRLIALAAWMREQYGATMIQALKTVLPVKQKMKQKEERWIRLLLEKDEAENQLELCRKKHYVARQRLLEALLENDTISYTLAMDKLHLTASVIKAMENTGMIRVQATEVYRNPIRTTECEQTKALLSPAQREVADGILNGWRENDFRPVVIHGVTGSGKTQVYMELMEEVLNQGKQVILLIPEIALTYQTVQRFYRRFGDRISVLHSRLSPGERSDQIERAKKGAHWSLNSIRQGSTFDSGTYSPASGSLDWRIWFRSIRTALLPISSIGKWAMFILGANTRKSESSCMQARPQLPSLMSMPRS